MEHIDPASHHDFTTDQPATPEADVVEMATSYAYRRSNGGQRSIKRHGSNSEYQAQDLPYATFPSEVGVVYRAGTEVGGQQCPRCPDYIAVTSPVVRLPRPEHVGHMKKWWVHERCFFTVEVTE